MTPDISTRLKHITLNNPIMTASGTCGYTYELNDFVKISSLGAFVTKSITLKPRRGNPPQRTVETPSGMLNAIGLANIGLDRFIKENMPLFDDLTIPLFVNVAEKSPERYVEVIKKVCDMERVNGIELNISCPNVHKGGVTIGADCVQTEQLVNRVKAAMSEDKLLIVKLTPNVTDISKAAQAAVDGGADCLSLINTITGMVIDIESRTPVIGNRIGGISGPAIRPIAVRMVNQVYDNVAKKHDIPIIGIGGIASTSDALQFIIAGASAIQVGTAVFTNPGIMTEIIKGIEVYMQKHRISKLSELIGSLK
jgi:dihydroorotate dehydrogenase (NAD+) catalytic subunit